MTNCVAYEEVTDATEKGVKPRKEDCLGCKLYRVGLAKKVTRYLSRIKEEAGE